MENINDREYVKKFKNIKNMQYTTDLDEVKKDYIEFLKEQGYQNNTLMNYKNVLYKIESWQKLINKNLPLHEYTNDEIMILLQSMQPLNQNVAKVYIGVIMDYLTYCVDQNLILHNKLNIKSILLDSNFLKSIISEDIELKKYVTEVEVYEAVDKIYNPVDKAMFLLIYNSIRGKQNCEITNLLKSNFNKEEKTLEFVNDQGEVKVLKLNDFLVDIIYNTIHQEFYFGYNGHKEKNKDKFTVGKEDGRSKMTIPFSKYLFAYLPRRQNSEECKENDYKMLGTTIQYRMLKILNEYTGLRDGHVTVESLYTSGIINNMIKYNISIKDEKLNQTEFIRAIQEFYNFKDSRAYRFYKLYDKLYEGFRENIVNEGNYLGI